VRKVLLYDIWKNLHNHPGMREIFRTRPGLPLCLSSLLYYRYQLSF